MHSEFFMASEKLTGFPIMAKHNGKYIPLDDMPVNDLKIIHQKLIDHPKASACLANMLKDGIITTRDRIEQFIKCNFSLLDNKLDIIDDTINFEYVKCENRKTCKQNYCVIKRKIDSF